MDEVEARERLSRFVLEARGSVPQREFARRLGVSLGALQAWEEARSLPGTKNLTKIAASAGQTTEALLGYLQGNPLPRSNDVGQVLNQIEVMPDWEFAQVMKAVSNRLCRVAEAPATYGAIKGAS
jgi:transcriptional regulator with XRE-family HTH domain